MADVIVERDWTEPLTDAEVADLFAKSADCLGIHRIEWQGSLLSGDRRDLVCYFTAPDTESVRIALRQTGSAAKRVYAGSIHEPAGLTRDDRHRANVLVSRQFDEPVVFEDIQAQEDAGKGCLETHRVRFVRTWFSSDRTRMLCLYEAPDAESVRLAQREARMPVERIFAVRRYDP